MNTAYPQSQSPQIQTQIARLTEVESLIGYKRSAIYERVKRGEFPPPIKLGPRRIAWLLSDVNCWVQSRIEASQAAEQNSDKAVAIQGGPNDN